MKHEETYFQATCIHKCLNKYQKKKELEIGLEMEEAD